MKRRTFNVWKLLESQPHAVTVQRSGWSVITKLQNVQFRYRHGSPVQSTSKHSPKPLRGHLTISHFLTTSSGSQPLPAPSAEVSPVPQVMTSSPPGTLWRKSSSPVSPGSAHSRDLLPFWEDRNSSYMSLSRSSLRKRDSSGL